MNYLKRERKKKERMREGGKRVVKWNVIAPFTHTLGILKVEISTYRIYKCTCMSRNCSFIDIINVKTFTLTLISIKKIDCHFIFERSSNDTDLYTIVEKVTDGSWSKH